MRVEHLFFFLRPFRLLGCWCCCRCYRCEQCLNAVSLICVIFKYILNGTRIINKLFWWKSDLAIYALCIKFRSSAGCCAVHIFNDHIWSNNNKKKRNYFKAKHNSVVIARVSAWWSITVDLLRAERCCSFTPNTINMSNASIEWDRSALLTAHKCVVCAMTRARNPSLFEIEFIESNTP